MWKSRWSCSPWAGINVRSPLDKSKQGWWQQDGERACTSENTCDYFNHRMDYMFVTQSFGPAQGQGVYGLSSRLVLAWLGPSMCPWCPFVSTTRTRRWRHMEWAQIHVKTWLESWEGQHVCENLEQAGYLVQSAYLPNLAHSHYKSNFNEVGFPSVPPSMTTEERTYHRTQFSLDRTCAHGHSGNSTDRNSPHY